MGKLKRIRKIDNKTFETDSVVEKFGEKVTKHSLLASGAEAQQLETQSKVHLEEDQGSGAAVILRIFEFGMNVEAIKLAQPSKQDIFNSHLKGIELALWRDGFKVHPDVSPKIIFDTKNLKYKIFVAARPMRGNHVSLHTNTLSDIVHNRT